jgi:membrane-associated phospholipid phosphatase
MPRSSKLAFAGAALGVCALALTWYLAHDLAALRRVDANVLGGFYQLGRPNLNRVTESIAGLCDPFPFIVLAAVPVAIALLRGRPRVALTIAVLLLGANESTEVLKPLLTGARDPVPGLFITHSTWPSGHATACMSLALAMVISVPARRRPVAAAVMAAFCVAITYSFLELGWHYPSDVLGGFEMSTTWALLAVGGLTTYEAHHPVAGARAAAGPSFSVAEALAPAALLIACGAAFAAALTVLRPHTVYAYAAAHSMFVVGAAVIAFLSFCCAAGVSLVLRGGPAAPVSGSGPAPTAAHRRRWPPG